MASVTHRVYIDYITGNVGGVSKEHTAMLRVTNTLLPVDAGLYAQDRFLALLQALTPAGLRSGWRVLRARVVPNGADFSLPYEVTIALGAFSGTGTTNGWTGANEAIQATWIGRSTTTGKRARISLYGLNIVSIDSNFRFTPGESTIHAATAVTALNQSAELVAADNTEVFWYSYMNLNYNSYWESRIRRG